MDVGTTNSSIASSSIKVTAGQQQVDLPILNERRASTTVSVQSGQTIIIGGLISTTDDKRVTKMPLLGDIPVLGVLFRSSHLTRDRKELLILLTPQILTNEKEVGDLRDIGDVTHEQLERSRIKDEIKRDELQKQLLDPLFPPSERPEVRPLPGPPLDDKAKKAPSRS
jgi:type II secretory pathway component GspD/PulD (secretin)